MRNKSTIINCGAIPIHIFRQGADHATSMKLLEEAGLRPLTYQEAFYLLAAHDGMWQALKACVKWFWLAGRGLDKDGVFKTSSRGELIKIWGVLSGSVIVRASGGAHPLSLGFAVGKALFRNAVYLGANVLPSHRAPGVVGVAKDIGNLVKGKPPAAVDAKAIGRKATFEKLIDSSGRALYVLRQKANYPTALKLLADAGLTLLTHPDILNRMLNDPKLQKSFKEKWFWLAGKGIHRHGYFTVDEHYEIVPRTGKRTAISRERMVLVRKGAQPLAFEVSSDVMVSDPYRLPRFTVRAENRPDEEASLVVGRRSSRPAREQA